MACRGNLQNKTICVHFFANFDVLFANIIYFLYLCTQANKVQELIQVTYDFSSPSVKLFNREVGGLTKASKITHCDNL